MITTEEIIDILVFPITDDSDPFSHEVRTLLVDSRSLVDPEGTMFFALKTKSNDGHRYVSGLLNKGVKLFVVTHIPEDVDPELADNALFFVVSDPYEALRDIALYCRKRMTGLHSTLAITGSYGKTVVKEWAYSLIRDSFKDTKVWRSPRSYNSQIGVPLSVWSAAEHFANQYIFEVGISRIHEMFNLYEVLKPELGVLTNIGDAHNEGFDSRRQKCMQKLDLFGRSYRIVVPEDDALVMDCVRESGLQGMICTVSSHNPNAWLYVGRTHEQEGTRLDIRHKGKGYEVFTHFTEPHDLDNLTMAIATVLVHQFPLSKLIYSGAINNLRKIDVRLSVLDGINGTTVISDPFSTDIQSMVPAIDFARRRASTDRPLIVITSLDDAQAGKIKELGTSMLLSICSDEVPDFVKRLPGNIPKGAVILVSGMEEDDLNTVVQHLEARRHETVLEVSLDAIAHNYNTFKSLVPAETGVICMVKASGYGAGAEETAKTLHAQGAAYAAVAVCDEGLALRTAGVSIPIMVMNPRSDNYFVMFNNRLEPEIYSFELLDEIIKAAEECGMKQYPLHIKIDTGMHRLGFMPDELQEVARRINATDAVAASSVFSHLATADCPDQDDYTTMQLELFDYASEAFIKQFDYPVRRHLLNSAGIVRFGRTKYAYDMVRLGISLYGIGTIDQAKELQLKPASALYTSIINLRTHEAGSSVGYGRKGRLERDTVVATLPVGYADGLDRRLGNGTLKVAVNGHRCPVIGNVCMDACMIDVTGVECAVGDRVEIFGPTVTPEELAGLLGTISYEVLTSVSERVRRVYYRE